MKNQRPIKSIHQALRDDIADLTTFRALPTHTIDHIDPFLFLNHHGPQVYPPNNHGLPFGPHPHRGFETVTFIIDGDIAHKDTGGHESVIKAGGIQWMTAGRGLVHSEESSKEFMNQGGPMEILQLWVNLPSHLKMTEPRYIGLQANEIPLIQEDNFEIQLVSGKWKSQQGAVSPLFDIDLMTVQFHPGAKTQIEVPAERNIFFYLVRGELKVNQKLIKTRSLVEFANQGSALEIEADQNALLLFGHSKPHNQPIVSYGPFVMNTKEEIHQAIRDYQSGKLR